MRARLACAPSCVTPSPNTRVHAPAGPALPSLSPPQDLIAAQDSALPPPGPDWSKPECEISPACTLKDVGPWLKAQFKANLK